MDSAIGSQGSLGSGRTAALLVFVTSTVLLSLAGCGPGDGCEVLLTCSPASTEGGNTGATGGGGIGGAATQAGAGGVAGNIGGSDPGGFGGVGGDGGDGGMSTTGPQVVAGHQHTCARLDSGVARCWGSAGLGRLGYGNISDVGDDEAPLAAGDVDVGGEVVQLAAGVRHSCALLVSGSVRCWGDGANGRLGYGNVTVIGDNEAPASVGDVNVGGVVVQLTAGYHHTCALLGSGAVRCWGFGGNGRLGYGNTEDVGDDESPASAGDVDVGGTVVQIVAGSLHTCALLNVGKVRCWGFGGGGQLGYGNTSSIGDDESPAFAGDVNVGGDVTRLSAGGGHTCAVLMSGAVRCWGDGGQGVLGHGNELSIGDNEAPASAGDVNVGGTATAVAAGGLHTCALLTTGRVRCWGRGAAGQLGYENANAIGDDEDPASAGDVDVGGTVVQVTTGGDHTCALLDDDAVRCWGFGGNGRLGYASTANVGNQPGSMPPPDVQVE